MVAPPKKSRTGLYVAIVIVLLVVIIGAVLFLVLGKKSGTGNGSSGVALTTYTSSDRSFSVGYPSGWQQHTASGGTGVEFTGPANQEVFEVVNLGPTPLSPSDVVNAGCSGGGGTVTAGPSSVTVGGQQWTRVECNITSGTNGTPVHAVVEAASYKGNGFLIVYGSSQANFASDQSNYYTPMEQSFMFLS